MKTWYSIVLASAAVLSLVACGDASGPDAEPTSASEETFTRTIVHLDANGATTSLVTEAVSASEQLGFHAAPARGPRDNAIGIADHIPPVRDIACAGTSMWLFDRADLTGNELCLYATDGAGTARLSDFPRRACSDPICNFANWSRSVRSFWAGKSRGMFTDGGSQYAHFAAYERQPAANAAVQGAQFLTLDY
jgi:hypothetical protein